MSRSLFATPHEGCWHPAIARSLVPKITALRMLAAELGVDGVHNVRSGKVARGDALLGTDAATITGRVIDAEAGFRRWQV